MSNHHVPQARPQARLHHTHLMASDVDATVAFWTDCLSATLVADTTMASVRNVLLDVGGGRLNLYDQPPNHRGPVNHLGVQVTDVGAVVDKLVAHGWTPRPTKTDGPLTYAMVEGPDRLLLEIFRFEAAGLDPALRPYFDLDDPAVESAEPVNHSDVAVPGAGRLSDAAQARLARPPIEPLRPPDISDHTAVSEWRAGVHLAWLDGDPSAEECGFENVMVGGVRCLQNADRGQRTGIDQKPLLIYFHGGGFALGSPEVALPITERLAGASGTKGAIDVVSVDYRLAPEHPYPAAVEDGMAVYQAVADAEPNRRVILGGDSAGANIALALAVRLFEANGIRPPQGLILLSPHVTHQPDSHHPADPMSDVDGATAAWLSAAYLGDMASDDPEVSPLLANLSGLPPTLIQVGTRDGSLSHGVRFARRARAAGVEVTLDVWEDLWHTWHYHRDLPEADQAIIEAAAFACRSAVRRR